MKISKVNNYKVAVIPPSEMTKKSSDDATGVLYRDPTKYNNTRSLEEHVRAQIRSAQRLYNVFNPVKEISGYKRGSVKNQNNTLSKEQIEKIRWQNEKLKKEKTELNQIKDITKTLNRSFKEYIDGYTRNGGSGKRMYELLQSRRLGSKKYERSILDRCITQYLRKSLYLSSWSEFKVVLYAINDNQKWNELGDEQKKQIERVHDILLRDYKSEKRENNIVKSIKNQNMLIQPEEGKLVPAVINSDKQRKIDKKEALTRFLSEYAVLDEQDRKNMRIKMRRIVRLYFYDDCGDLKEGIDEWTDHALMRKNSASFSDEAAELCMDAMKKKAEKNFNKKDRNDCIKAIREAYRKENKKRYSRSIAVLESDSSGKFFEDQAVNVLWLEFISETVEKIYTNIKIEEFYFTTGYIGEKTWKRMINYISVKYIAIGKAVFHYAMEDIMKAPEGNLNLGEICKKVNSLTSFDYEQIKAEEELQRNISSYTAFSANHLSSATLVTEEKYEDLLVIKEEDIRKLVKPGIRRNILKFFGGESTWKDFRFEEYYAMAGKGKGGKEESLYDDTSFLCDLKNIVYSVRNETFHFRTRVVGNGEWNMKLIGAMFEHDCKTAGKLQKDKFYSNNLPMFYDTETLEKLLSILYKKPVVRTSQVPSFNKVLVRGDFPQYIRGRLRIKPSFDDNSDLRNQYDGAMYYLFKEIYYNLFLQGKSLTGEFDTKERFIQWSRRTDNENQYAKKNFGDRVTELCRDRSITLSEICQRIMTDYNQYNNQNRKVKSNDSSEKNPDNYDHYKKLLLIGLKEVFAEYIESALETEKYKKLKSPVYREKMAEEDFLPNYQSPTYRDLSRKVADSAEMQKWYIIARFLNPRQSNLFSGIFTHYMQYVAQIKRRAKQAGCSVKAPIDTKHFLEYVAVINVCTQLAGRTTNCLEDYFDNADDYARYVGNFMEYGDAGTDRPAELLARFSRYESQKYSAFSEELIQNGVFFDYKNPILNRNILLSQMYGMDKVLINLARDSKITVNDLEQYYDQKKKIKDYPQNKKTVEEIKEVKKYQEIKNRIEFRDNVEYEEIIDELQAQLIKWSYLRERDLLYFQLGFHYNSLLNDSFKPEYYRTIYYDNPGNKQSQRINGAILYQIAALYIMGVPIYSKKTGKLKPNRGNLSTPTKIRMFLLYTAECQNQAGMEIDDKQYYNAGLELFENINEHDRIVDLRNYIEHFKYYTLQDRSMLDIYGEMFDRFFTYDMKYQKNVLNMVYNTLMHHFIKPTFEFTESEKIMNDGTIKKRAAFTLKDEKGLSSEKLTYKMEEGKKTVKINAKSDRFIQDVKRLLNNRVSTVQVQ